MPACFNLTKKGEREPATLVSVDEAICAHMGVTPDPIKYFYGWYDCIGFRLATGVSIESVREEFNGYISQPDSRYDGEVKYYTVILRVLSFLESNYEHDAWHSSKAS